MSKASPISFGKRLLCTLNMPYHVVVSNNSIWGGLNLRRLCSIPLRNEKKHSYVKHHGTNKFAVAFCPQEGC